MSQRRRRSCAPKEPSPALPPKPLSRSCAPDLRNPAPAAPGGAGLAPCPSCPGGGGGATRLHRRRPLPLGACRPAPMGAALGPARAAGLPGAPALRSTAHRHVRPRTASHPPRRARRRSLASRGGRAWRRLAHPGGQLGRARGRGADQPGAALLPANGARTPPSAPWPPRRAPSRRAHTAPVVASGSGSLARKRFGGAGPCPRGWWRQPHGLACPDARGAGGSAHARRPAHAPPGGASGGGAACPAVGCCAAWGLATRGRRTAACTSCPSVRPRGCAQSASQCWRSGRHGATGRHGGRAPGHPSGAQARVDAGALARAVAAAFFASALWPPSAAHGRCLARAAGQERGRTVCSRPPAALAARAPRAHGPSRATPSRRFTGSTFRLEYSRCC